MKQPTIRGWGWMAAGGAVAALWIGAWTTPLEVRQVTVTGIERMARADVVRLAGVPPGSRLDHAGACRVEASLGKLPAFSRVTVTRGLTGTLHVRVTERPPAAWLPRAGCAVAADGLLLAHVTRREPGWVALEGLGVAQGRVAERAVFAEALELSKLIAALGGTEAGSVRRVSGEGWEWTASGRRIRISSPLVPDELRRLRRFRESFPAEWKNATRLDLRFLGRVVVKS